ncbi:PREDICTED: sporozoite surface protein 2-like [Rhagoletis zephyria]|uniref:sporozoite surface protein 2-like n=1 Tax=Rhagoletis zephyria TaxID=28612 RepID=UPI0008113985|nr:PREDICTED: sporozoite surface protein 2-like [Rhagoletis zephyria]
MRKFIILASLVACCVAAPTLQQTSKEQQDHSVLLQRPSPINPDVPSDPKPPEQIIKITDPKEIVKHKREADDDPYNHISRFAPTAHPTRQAEKQHSHESEEKHLVEADPTHHREKREKQQIKDTRKSENAPAPPAPANKAAVKKDSPKRPRGQNGPTKSIVPTPEPARDLPKHRHRRQVDPHLLGASTVGVTPLIYQDDDKKLDEAEAQHEVKSSEESTESTAKPATHESTQVKRDIPVPLVPKYHHPEESPNSKNQEVEAVKNNEHHPNDEDSKSHESDESDEDSKEKKPAPAIQNHQPINQAGQPLPAQQHQIQIPAQPSHPDIENNKPIEVHNNGEPLEVRPHVGQQHQTQTSAQPSHAVEQNDKPEPDNPQHAQQHQHTEDPATEQNKPHEVHNNESVLEQLAGIKPTQIINYETPASEITVPIKHPVPVAELFSRPKQ